MDGFSLVSPDSSYFKKKFPYRESNPGLLGESQIS
jgi:hypothetical protein